MADDAAQAEQRAALAAEVAGLDRRDREYLLGRLVAATPVSELRRAVEATRRRAGTSTGFGQR